MSVRSGFRTRKSKARLAFLRGVRERPAGALRVELRSLLGMTGVLESRVAGTRPGTQLIDQHCVAILRGVREGPAGPLPVELRSLLGMTGVLESRVAG